jgi:Lanthionine synthetase C-like protein
MSPIASSPVGATVLRILAACDIHDTSTNATGSRVSKSDVAILRDVIDTELKHGHTISYRNHIMGGDEVLYGRAGLLWAALNIRQHIRHDETHDILKPILESIPKLIDAIIESGRQGSLDFVKQYGKKEAFPLMWLWMENYYGLGA